MCQKFRDTLNTLHTAGHIQYITIYEQIAINSPTSIETFATKCNHLNTILVAWEKDLEHARQDWYLMNYIRGCQIHLLYLFLTTTESRSKRNADSILKFIHPEMSADILFENFHKENEGSEHVTFLNRLGAAVHTTYVDPRLGLISIQRTLETEERKQAFGEIVHRGKLLLAVLNEKSELVLRTILALYQGTHDMLPEPYQLLFCTSETTWNEIELHLARCKGAYQFYKMSPLFCLANIELLTNDLQFKLVDKLRRLQTMKEFRLALICRGSFNNPFVDLLSSFVVSVKPISELTESAILQRFCPNVITLTSEVPGLGKTTMVSRLARQEYKSTAVLHISGVLDREQIIRELRMLHVKPYHMLHINIGNIDRPLDLDLFIFQLIIMGIVSEGKHSLLRPTEHVCIEIANTINNTMCRSMSCAASFKREHLTWQNFDDFIVSRDVNSPVQIVCNYLKLLKSNTLNETELRFSGIFSAPPLQDKTCKLLLKEYLSLHADMSFSIVNIFLNVLSDQLKKFTCSAYFKVSHISDMIGKDTYPVIRSSLVSAMVEVAREFASRSVSACRSTQAQTLQDSGRDSVATLGIPQQLVSRSDSMIRWEESNHLIYVFHNQDIQTLSVMYRERSKVPPNMQDLFKKQIKRDMVDYNVLPQRDLQTILQRVARVQKHLLDEIKLKQMTSEYALTPDNLLKMVLIMLRISAKVPVVVMGETGCGKTSLIRYLANVCEVPFNVFSIHSGISQDEIEKTIVHENNHCLQNMECQRWLFLDEINTSESVGLISEIICHHKCKGLVLAPNLIIIGACNPYKLRTKESITTAGLSGKVKTDDLSKLVYRVLPLPEMLTDYVWDFGSLTDADELKYIERMTETVFNNDKAMNGLLRDLIFASHRFVRDQQKTTYSVSLRDVERCKSVLKWFMQNWTFSSAKSYKETTYCNMLLALSVCYQSRFDAREIRSHYRQELSLVFHQHDINKTERDVHIFIKTEQHTFLKCMDLPQGTAKNTALQENVFLITVCILNKIPIFVVGKPGCSKSLAMQVIRSNLRGKDSKQKLFKQFPQLYCVSFQGSESSTSDGILKVFNKAEEYQENNKKDTVLSVVILDEVGLAEVSKFNPLKVLHHLLEPDGRSNPNVAVVGISNWSLDASKMNRGIHLSRPDMDEDELFDTAVSISESYIDSKKTTGLGCSTITLEELLPDLKATASSYCRYIESLQLKNFHGLRDYYALVKFIAKGYVDNPNIPRTALIRKGLERNFGGLSSEKQSLMHHFRELLEQTPDYKTCVGDIIKANIQDEQARHLMIITEGESVLGILEQKTDECGRKQRETIFGSQFKEDLTDDYHYRMLSKVILCMEQGMLLILKDLDGIYGSLYDMLNQNYTTIGKKNNCRVALGPYSNPFCHVAEHFRCIVLVESKRLNMMDPPFLNRFEKQSLSIRDIMTCDDSKLMHQLNDHVQRMSLIQGTQFSEQDVFPYINDELLASLAILSSQTDTEDRFTFCQKKLLWFIKPDALIRLHRARDSSIRTKCHELQHEYFLLPVHSGLRSFIDTQKNDLQSNHLTIIYTYSNVHTRIDTELEGLSVQTEKINTFKSERQLSARLTHFWEDTQTEVLIVQCHAVDDAPHILLTKTLIQQARVSAASKRDVSNKRVYYIIHLSCRGSGTVGLEQLNFLSRWDLVTMERLEKVPIGLQELCHHSLQENVRKMMPLNQLIADQLFWAFSRIRYGQRGRNNESIENVIKDIESNPDLLRELEQKIFQQIQIDIGGEVDTDWWIHVACDFNAIVTNVFFTEALQKRILDTIRYPLAKIIFRLEEHGALFSYTIQDDKTDFRRTCWRKFFHDEKQFMMNNVPQVTGPYCFNCSTPDVKLELPFVYGFFKNVQKHFESFKNEVLKTKVKCGLSSDDEIPLDVFKELFDIQRDIMVPDLRNYNDFGYLNKDTTAAYLDDFCNLFSHDMGLQLPEQSRIGYTKWAVMHVMNKYEEHPQSFEIEVSFLHCCVWVHYDVLRDIMQLFETYEAVCRLQGRDNAYEHFSNHFFVENMGVHSYNVLDSAGQYQSVDENHSSCTPVTSVEETKVIGRAIEVNTLCKKSNKLETSDESDKFTYFVQILCLELVPIDPSSELFSKPEEWQILSKQVLLSAENISITCKEYQALKIVSELSPILMTQVTNKQNISNLCTLFRALHEDNIDSESVLNAYSAIIERSLDSNLQPEAVESMRQYLVSCLTLDTSTRALKLPCAFVLNRHSFDDHIHRLYVPFSCAVDFAVETKKEEGKPILTRLIVDPEYTLENENLFACLNETTKLLIQQGRIDSPFILMLTDIFQANLSDDMDFYLSQCDVSEIVLLSGRILQNQNQMQGDIRLIIAIAFLKMTRMMYDDEHINDKTWNAVFEGLDNTSTLDPLVMFFLRKSGLDKLICKAKQNCEAVSCRITSLEKVTWTEGYEWTCLENNPFYVILETDLVSSFKTCSVEQNKRIYLFSNNIKSFINNVVKSLDESHVPIYIIALAITNFYLTKHRSTDTTMTHYASRLLSLTSDFSPQQQEFIKYIVDLKQFALQSYVISTETDDDRYMINYVLVTLHANTLCGHDRSLLMTCMLNASDLGNMFLPGCQDKCYLHDEENELLTVWDCTCGRMLYINDDSMKKKKCTSCGNEFDSNIHLKNVKSIGYIVENLPGIRCFQNNPAALVQRDLTPLSSTILQWFMFGCIHGSLAFNFQTEDQVKLVLGCGNPGQFLDETITSGWNTLKRLTHFNNLQLGIYLLLIVRESRAKLFQENIELRTHAMRCAYEQEFDKVVKDVDKNKHMRVNECIRACDFAHGLSNESVELKMRESNQPNSEDIENLFRLTSCAIKEEFIAKLYNTVSCNEVPFPFLMSIVENEQLLYLPQYIYDIIQWHLATVMAINCKQKRQSCLKYSVDEFHRKINDISLRAISKTRFKAFRKAMGSVTEVLVDLGICQQNITKDSLMTYCLILDADSHVYQTLKKLVSIQNSFIVKSMKMSLSCKNLQFLCSTANVANVSRVSVVDVISREEDKGNLVKLNSSWMDSVCVESHSTLKYGCGFDIDYNFDRIEKRLAESLLFGKSFIDLDYNRLPHIVFVDELYKTFVSLVDDIRSACPQEELPKEVEHIIRDSASKNPDMATELINELDVLMTVMKRTSMEPSTLLDAYIETRRNTIGKHFPLQHLVSTKLTLKVCHVVSLHELLEEMCTDQLLDGIADEFKVPLDEDSEKQIRSIQSAYIGDILLKAVKRFYYRCIEIGNMDAEQSIIPHLANESFWPTDVCIKGKLIIEGQNMDLSEIIPDDVRVANIGSLVAIITEVVEVSFLSML